MGIALSLASMLGRTLLAMLTSLLTEEFLKRAVIDILEKLVANSKSELEMKLLDAARDAWKMPKS